MVFFDKLMRWLKSLQRTDASLGLPARSTLHINAIIVSHFDLDHYHGLTKVLTSDKFTVGRIYHNGLPRYGDNANKGLNLDSVTHHSDDTRSISTDFRGIDSTRQLVSSGLLFTDRGNDNKFSKFLQTAIKTHDSGRFDDIDLLVKRKPDNSHPTLSNTGSDMTFEAPAPAITKPSEAIRLPAFPDPHDVTDSNPQPTPSGSHTINGNSVVLWLIYGNTMFLFGDDLNQPAQAYLG